MTTSRDWAFAHAPQTVFLSSDSNTPPSGPVVPHRSEKERINTFSRTDNVVAVELWLCAFCYEADCAMPTSQTQTFLVFTLRELSLVLCPEVLLYDICAGPCKTTEGTVAPCLMPISNMPCQVRRSIIRLIATILRARPLLGTSTSAIGPLRALRFRRLLGDFQR